MTATVTVTAAAASDMTARVTLSVTGAAPGELLSVVRQIAGVRTPVLGATAIDALSTVLIDAACPLNQSAVWVVLLEDGSEEVSNAVTLASELPVLSDPWAGLETYVRVVDSDETLTRRARAEVLMIEGSDEPVVVYDVPTGHWATLRILTLTAAEAAAVDRIAASGGPMLLRCSCGRHPDRWVAPAGDVVTARTVKDPAVATRIHSWDPVIYRHTAPMDARPAGDTLGDLAALVPTDLGDVAATWSTLGEIAATDMSGGL